MAILAPVLTLLLVGLLLWAAIRWLRQISRGAHPS